MRFKAYLYRGARMRWLRGFWRSVVKSRGKARFWTCRVAPQKKTKRARSLARAQKNSRLWVYPILKLYNNRYTNKHPCQSPEIRAFLL